MGIVLASASPRRRELLGMIGVREFRVLPAEGEESVSGLEPGETVCRIALGKARSVAVGCDGGDIILAADTLVYLGGEPLGKPADAEDAARMLRMLSGRVHTVYTGIALLRGGESVTAFEATDVYFREISDTEIANYVATGEPLDKAGAYGAQGRGAVFIRRIEGDYFNVVGLPLCRLSLMLREFGVGL